MPVYIFLSDDDLDRALTIFSSHLFLYDGCEILSFCNGSPARRYAARTHPNYEGFYSRWNTLFLLVSQSLPSSCQMLANERIGSSVGSTFFLRGPRFDFTLALLSNHTHWRTWLFTHKRCLFKPLSAVRIFLSKSFLAQSSFLVLEDGILPFLLSSWVLLAPYCMSANTHCPYLTGYPSHSEFTWGGYPTCYVGREHYI